MRDLPAARPVSGPVPGLRRRLRSDDGTSLIELMVGMTLMTVFMAMFTGAIVMMNNAMNKTQAISQGTSQLNVSFQNLDTIVRYASAISAPGLSTAVGATRNWYVELRTTYTGAEACTQLRVDISSQQLQQRTWKVTGGVASAVTSWVPIASGISNGGAIAGPTTQPFYLKDPLKDLPRSPLFQQLTVNLAAPAGSGSALTTTTSTFTLTAMNSSLPVPTSPICQELGRP